MSMNLAELGRAICQEFDQRKLELDTLHSDILKKVKGDQKELNTQQNTDNVNLQIDRKQIWEDTSNLLNKYRVERKTMEHSLHVDRSLNIHEIKAWVNERGKELKGWYEAGGYMSRKRTGR